MANNSGNYPPLPEEEDLEMGRLELSEDRGPSNVEESEPHETINRLREKLAEKDKQLLELTAQKDNHLEEKEKELAENEDKLAERLIELKGNFSEEIALYWSYNSTKIAQLEANFSKEIDQIQQSLLKGNYMQKIVLEIHV